MSSDGLIQPDSELARRLGFTSDKFEGWLWKHDKYIYISSIISKKPGSGNFRSLVNNILKLGFGVKVPTPSTQMRAILERWGFRRTTEYAEEFNDYVEVWVKEAEETCNMLEVYTCQK